MKIDKLMDEIEDLEREISRKQRTLLFMKHNWLELHGWDIKSCETHAPVTDSRKYLPRASSQVTYFYCKYEQTFFDENDAINFELYRTI